ncbi:MAG TPA: FG-GAP-like repeat-containing protein [Pyrinomonadaceae bacterium]|nr:FG-GAP-like repeat-containing protein [Pyrinomonadaceae bacterium]
MLTPRMKKLFIASFGLLAVAVLLISAVAVNAAGGDVVPMSDVDSSRSFSNLPAGEAKSASSNTSVARTSTGNFAPLAAQGCAGASFAAATNFGTGTSPISVTNADFNKDGNLDLAVANNTANTVSVLLGNGMGGFGTKADFGTGSRPFSVTTADFNKDGNLDLAVTNVFSFDVSVLLGNGAGGFAPKVDFITGGESRGVTTADFNKDGNLDLAVATQNSNKVAVLLGNGAGSFATRVEYAAGTTAFFVATGDFNKDGNADLAVANQTSNNVSVLLGDGAGSFAPKVDYAAGTGPRYVLTADFNKDGNLDLAVANFDSNNISLLLGDGAGGFAPKVDYSVTSYPFSLTTADFNRDGNLDLAAANNSFSSFVSTTVSVLLGNGAGGFAPKTDFNTGNNPFSVSSGDFNKDGSPDLAVANLDSANVSVLINACVPPPNTAPIASATPNPAQTNEDTLVQITLTGTDSEDNNLSYTITDAPDHGTLSAVSAPDCTPTNTCTANVTYTPAPNYNGADSFKFKVNDGTVDSAEETVQINVSAVADLSINDVARAEGNTGQTTFTFTLTLDSAAPAGGVTFTASTADGTANSGSDYTGFTNQAGSISAGQTSTTIEVNVNGDTTLEVNETFNVNISNPTNATISDGQGTGTILNDDGSPTPGQIIISEFRFRGPDPDGPGGTETGEQDEFIELYNTTDSDFVVVDSSPLPALASRGWAIVSDDPLNLDPTELTTPKFVIPVGTRIPARGHYLITNGLGYSLSSYAAADAVSQEAGGGAASYFANIGDGSGLSLYRTGNPVSFTSDQQLDSVGFTGSAFFETTPLAPTGGINTPVQHSFVRKLTTGRPQDTQNNEADFQFVEVSGATSNGRAAVLGAPGPENSESPFERNATVKASLVEPGAASTVPPNRVRSGQVLPGVPNAFGTLSIQRRFKNTTGAPVTRLRFRIVDITTRNSPGASSQQADLRVLSSTGVVTNSQGQEVVRVTGLKLEEPPVQSAGGGQNTTLTVVLPGGSLATGSTIDVQFLLGVEQGGAFRFLVNVEAVTGQPAMEEVRPGLKMPTMKNAQSSKEQ